MICKLKYNTFHIFISYLVVLLVFSSCNKEESETSETELLFPGEKNIPHINHNHILLKKEQSIDKLTNKPEELNHLHKYLKNPDSYSAERVAVLMGEPSLDYGVHVTSIGEGRMVFLDVQRSNLIEYDINAQNSITLAEFGRGPEGLHFPAEIDFHDNFVFVAREDGYISIFDCQSIPCTFEEAILLEFTPVSINIVDEEIAVLGALRGSRSEVESQYKSGRPVRIVDRNGLIRDTFGDFYDVPPEHSFLLTNPDFSSGFIRYSPVGHLFVLVFPRLPFLYVYDADTLQLKETYKISDFILGRQRFLPESRRLYIVDGDLSFIRNTDIVDGKYLLVETMTMSNRQLDGINTIFDYNIDYYIVDLSDTETYFIGGYKGGGKEHLDKSIKVLPKGLIIYDYEDGSLFWVKI